MENPQIAEALIEVSKLLQLEGANPFRVRAYETGARQIEFHGQPLRQMVADGEDLTQIEGIGKDLAAAIEELVTTGRLGRLDELRERVPAGLLDVMQISGVGPKRTQRLWEELDVVDLETLEEAARDQRIRSLKGFGKKTEEQILEGIAHRVARGQRTRIDKAERLVTPLVEHLEAAPGAQRVTVAGSYRRCRESVGDIDLLAVAEDPEAVIQHLLAYDGVAEVAASGDTKATVFLASSLQVDLRVVPPESFGAALVYFTGSKAHNIKLRRRSLERDLRLSEYGLYEIPEGSGASGPTGEWVAGREEADIYERLDLAWIPPELREDLGEIEAAEREELPELITLDDLRGDLQMHTTWSDGRHGLDQMVEAAAGHGHEYIAITDHSFSLTDRDKLERYFRAIETIDGERDDITVLKSLEVDVRRDGSLAVDDDVLERCDVVVVAVHNQRRLPVEEQTDRLLKALAHPKVQIMVHPTGRHVDGRPPMAFDIDRVLAAAAERGVALEINAHPKRQDLPDTYARRAVQLGCKLVISTDAHNTEHLGHLKYGVKVARRAWVEPSDVINTLPLQAFLKSLRGKA